MITKEFYRKYGIRNVSNYTTPQIGILKDFPVIKDSVYYHIGSFTQDVPAEEGWLLDNINKTITVFTPDRLTVIEGKASKVYNLRAVLKPYIRKTDKYNFVHNIGKLDNVPKTIPVVINYAHLDKLYRRPNNISKDFDTLSSTIKSLVSDIEKGMTNRIGFIDIRLPLNIETLNDYINLLKKGKNYYVKYFNNFEDFVLTELIKLISYDISSTSIFSKLLEVEDKRSLYFILRTGHRFTTISLYDLLAIDERHVEGPLGKKGKDSLKVFIKYILNMLVGSNIEDKDIDAKIQELKESKVIPKVTNKKIKEAVTVKETAIEEIDNNVSKGILDKDKADKLKKVISKSKEDVTRDEKEYSISKEDIALAKSPISAEESLKDPIGARDRIYLEKYYEKDTARVINHLNASGIIAVEEHTKEDTNTKISSITTHTITIKQSNGRSKTIIRHVPKPDKDGKIRINNNEYVFMKQKTDRPIRKINNSTVGLTSFFGKLMVSRGHYSKNNISSGLYKQLKSMSEDGTIKLLVEGSNKFKDVELPYWYTRAANSILSFVFEDMFFTFNYNFRSKFAKNLEKAEKHGTFIGTKGKYDLVIKEDTIYIIKDKPEELGKFLDVIGLSLNKLPLEQTTIQIRGKVIPLILPLLSYIPFLNLLSILAVPYTEHSTLREAVLEEGEYAVIFKDKVFKFSRDNISASMLLSGLSSIKDELKFYTVEDISTISGFAELYSMLGYPKSDLNELSLLKTMFIDPLTADILKIMKEPTTFPKLLIRANEMLVLDDYKGINNIDGTMLKSYERLNGMLYHSIVKELRVYKNSLGITNASMNSDPYAVMRMLNEDGSRELLEDINPIASLKQKENTTLLGFLGRSKESIPLDAREVDVSEVGLISEASKESSAVGITAYMSSSPNMDSLSGLIKPVDELNIYNVSSTASNLSPFGELDDGKRKLFNSVQAGHIIAIKNQRVMPILTGYEAVLGQRVESKFVTTAEDDGTVTSVSSKAITISYKKLGKKTYKIKDWYSKETAGETFRHVMVPLPFKGDKVSKGDTLCYDSSFFGPNIFDKKKVLYKTGLPVRMALYEDIINYEDSAGVSKRFSKKASADLIKVRGILMEVDNALIDHKVIGDKVEYSTPLLINRNIEDTNTDIKGKTLDILKDLVSDIPKAEVTGVIKDIQVYYRKDIKDIRGKLKKFIQESDDRLKENFGYTGLVDHTYSTGGVPLDINEIEIKYYIEYTIDMTHRDKGVLQNQLKFTIGDVYDKITTEDGEEIDITFSPTSVSARVVDSAYRSLATTTLMMAIGKKAVSMWEE